MNESHTESKRQRAADVFGGADALTDRLAVMIRMTREARGLTQEALAVRAQEGNAFDVAQLEENKELPAKNVLMAYLDALSLPLQNVLQIESLNGEQEQHWNAEMRRRKVALMAQANGVDPLQVATPEHRRWALELFLRIEALNEVCPAAKTMPDIKNRAARLQAVIGSF